MRLCSIASGSSGNCIYVGSDRTHLLVDTGISKKRIEEGLKELEIKGKELDGILITMNMQIIFRDLVYSAENMRSRSMEHRERFGESVIIKISGKCRKDFTMKSR